MEDQQLPKFWASEIDTPSDAKKFSEFNGTIIFDIRQNGRYRGGWIAKSQSTEMPHF